MTTYFLRVAEPQSHLNFGGFVNLSFLRKINRLPKCLKACSNPANFAHNPFISAHQAKDTCWCLFPYQDGTNTL